MQHQNDMQFVSHEKKKHGDATLRLGKHKEGDTQIDHINGHQIFAFFSMMLSSSNNRWIASN
jgi:hypothetical protein